MAVGRRAIGLIGTGIDVCNPKENKELYEKVLERGAILSELPRGAPPVPENFPVRNRIIAGIRLGVAIVEGKQYSGLLITARLAMEFGREVFGVPGNVTQEMSFARSKASDQLRRCDRRAADADPGGFTTSRRSGVGAAESAGGRRAKWFTESNL
jgi:predicted Rossmann fold nucleotide-binding protein DprA/Smf involved in DNA uptake